VGRPPRERYEGRGQDLNSRQLRFNSSEVRRPMHILLQRALLAVPSYALLCTASITTAQEPGSGTLWYTKPAAICDEPLPIGNGRLGGMVFGGANTTANNGDQQSKRVNADIRDGSKTRPRDEHLQLNESTLWQGTRADKLNPRGHEGFLEARKLLLESQGTDGAKIAEAEKVLGDKMLSKHAVTGGTTVHLPSCLVVIASGQERRT
jgi:hypothetical protein